MNVTEERIHTPAAITGSSGLLSQNVRTMRLVKDLAIAFTFSTFAYMKVWIELTTSSANNRYLMKLPPGGAHYAAVLLNIALWSVALTAGITYARREKKPWPMRIARGAFLLGFLILFNSTRDVLLRPLTLRYQAASWSLAGHRPEAAVAIVLILLAAACLITRFNLAGVAAVTMLVLSPFAVAKTGQLLWRSIGGSTDDFADRACAPRLPVSPRQKRVVWVIFDEWDQRLTFENPTVALNLPELTRIRQEGFYADHALPPAGETLYSLPSLINGRIVRTAEASGPRDLELTYAGSQTSVPWSGEKTVFSSTRALGLNGAMVGWAHPYCRIFGDSTAFCHWSEVGMQYSAEGSTFLGILPNQSRALLETFNLSPFGQTLNTMQHEDAYLELMDSAKQAVADPGLSLVMVHLPAPHPPFFYDAVRRDYSLRQSPISGYYGALELVDRSIGELRSTLEQAGLWGQTTLVLSADHGCRFAARLDGRKDRRVPFLVRLAGDPRPFQFTAPFNTVLTKELILTILASPGFDARELAGWMSARARGAGSD
jgi:hypothetical protein